MMRKIFLLALIVSLSACTYGGGIGISGGSNSTPSLNMGINLGTSISL